MCCHFRNTDHTTKWSPLFLFRVKNSFLLDDSYQQSYACWERRKKKNRKNHPDNRTKDDFIGDLQTLKISHRSCRSWLRHLYSLHTDPGTNQPGSATSTGRKYTKIVRNGMNIKIINTIKQDNECPQLLQS